MAALLWVSSFGYLAVLRWKARRSHSPKKSRSSWPDIAVLIPVLNEENLIFSKLSNLRQADYPQNRLSVVVVDGGSTDRTVEILRRAMAQGHKLRLLCLEGVRQKAEQVVHALNRISQDIVVVTDADAVLERSCLKELVDRLENDPQAAIVGATVEPETPLWEERFHWRFLNPLWWLEGEALGAAGFSGVCYACRRSLVLSLSRKAVAEDIHLSLLAGANGHGVYSCREARIKELRVPQTLRDMLRYRRRRGAGYLAELRHPQRGVVRSSRWRLARFARLWHFLVTPKLAVMVLSLALFLLATPRWPWPLFVFPAFALPLLAALYSTGLGSGKDRWWRVPLVAVSYSALILVSLLTLDPRPSGQVPRGGKT